MKGLRKIAESLVAQCTARGLPPPPDEVSHAYAVAVASAQKAARELRRAVGDERKAAFAEFCAATRQMLAIRRSLGLSAGERRVYQGIRASRVAAAAALPADSIFSPLSPPPGFGRGKKNEAPN